MPYPLLIAAGSVLLAAALPARAAGDARWAEMARSVTIYRDT
jgi:hypothetical protein